MKAGRRRLKWEPDRSTLWLHWTAHPIERAPVKSKHSQQSFKQQRRQPTSTTVARPSQSTADQQHQELRLKLRIMQVTARASSESKKAIPPHVNRLCRKCGSLDFNNPIGLHGLQPNYYLADTTTANSYIIYRKLTHLFKANQWTILCFEVHYKIN
jgi:hypothetical protein